jgi:Zn-dependent M28 family amino/carboxypeptidase
MTEQQANILEKVSDLLGEHFASHTIAVAYEDSDGNTASIMNHGGSYYEALGLVLTHLDSLRKCGEHQS